MSSWIVPKGVAFAVQATLLLLGVPAMAYFRHETAIASRTWTLRIVSFALQISAAILDLAVTVNRTMDAATYRRIFMIRFALAPIILATYLPLFVRHYSVLRTTRLQAELSKQVGDTGFLDEQKAVSLRKQVSLSRQLSSERASWLVFATLAAVVIAITASIDSTFSMANFDANVHTGYEVIVNILGVVILGVTTLFLASYIFSAPNDNYHMKSMIIALIVIRDASMIVQFAANNAPSDVFVVVDYCEVFILPILVYIVEIVLPLLVVVRNKRIKVEVSVPSKERLAQRRMSIVPPPSQRLSSSSAGAGGGNGEITAAHILQIILTTADLNEAFEKFMAKEYCLENLLFLRTIEKYNRVVAIGSVQEAAQLRNYIANEFIATKSPNELNIPSMLRKECLEEIEQANKARDIGRTVFYDAEEHVRHIVIANSLARFQKTDVYKQLYKDPTQQTQQ
ncbi:hypothetical protein BC831DRAFT_23799 [Entophlyctis helioformis]|nr:hypothetical protein BC831DRAFT_23799 [Entophlyctis helioformis]